MKLIRLLFVLLCVSCCVLTKGTEEPQDKTSAKLDIECESELVVSLIKLSEEPLDLFAQNEVQFLIVSNSDAGVDLTVSSKNNGILKCAEGKEYAIPYELSIKIGNNEWMPLSFPTSTVQIPYSDFSKSFCPFSLKSKLLDNQKIEMPGAYTDTITISVVEHS